MRLLKFVLPVLLVVGLATPAWADPPPKAPTGWSVSGSQLVWRAPGPVPIGDAAVEFWDGDRLLGRPVPSADHRTFTLENTEVTDPHALVVRAGTRRLDVEEHRAVPRTQPTAAPAPQAAGEVDPGLPGPYRTRTGEYTLDSIQLPGYPAAVEMQAVVVAPVGAPGKRPLALFLHGRHQTCYDPTDPNSALLEWPCPDGTRSVPSYRGYLQAQQLLASQGYVTVSISANSINAQDADTTDAGAQARSSLVRQHLARWADWAGKGHGAAPDIVKATTADLSKVFLMGHSRGGEGVNRAAMDSVSPPPAGSGYDGPVRWTIRGTLLIGPTIFGQNPAPDVPSVTVLPGCDGDVSDLQGEMYLDATRGISRGAALHSALYVVGANHNFFNTEWTPGQSEAPSSDDFWADDDPVCSPGTPTRLTAAQQQNVGATYIAAAARLFVAGDRRVLPLVDGSGVRAPSADPARVLSHAVGAARTPFVVPDAATTASGGARMCKDVTEDEASACVAESIWQPHFVTLWGVSDDPDRFAVALSGAGTIRPAKPVSLAGSDSLALRIIVPPNTTGNRFDVAVTDTHGRTAQLGTVSVDGLSATSNESALWAQEVRVPLRGVDLRSVASLSLTSSGQAWLVDAYGWSSGLPDPRPVALPRVDVGLVAVEEGDSGTRHYEVPVSVSGNGNGNGTGTVRLFVFAEDGTFTTRLVTVRPGQQAIEIPFEVTGNTRWSTGSDLPVLAKAVHGAVSGGYVGGFQVLDDDPLPTFTVTRDAGTVAEGGTLTWTVTSSAVADSPIYFYGWPVPVTDGQELSSADVDPQWYRDHAFEEPLPSRPLSQTPVFVDMTLEPGSLTASLTIPTVVDDEAEPTEQVRFFLTTWPQVIEDQEVVGAVVDQS
jgi:hypothetical protein